MRDDAETLLENLRALVGSHGRPQVARDPVNQAAIRNWCDAIGMDSPRYTGDSAVAPAAMLCTWTLPGNIVVPEDPDCPRVQAFRVLREHGFSGIIGTGYEEEYPRPLRLGEVPSGTLSLTEVSDRKKTGLGEGYFLTTRTSYVNQTGEPVGNWVFRMLVYRPRQQPAAAEAAQNPPAAGDQENAPVAIEMPRRATTRLFHEVAIGDELPPWSIPVTSRLVITGAVATRDFSDLHLDAAAARRAGARDLFLNALTSSGLCSRYVEAWAGPGVEQKNIRLRFGVPAVAGDSLGFSASVAAKEMRGAHGLVTLNLVARGSTGDHLGGSLDLLLPL